LYKPRAPRKKTGSWKTISRRMKLWNHAKSGDVAFVRSGSSLAAKTTAGGRCVSEAQRRPGDGTRGDGQSCRNQVGERRSAKNSAWISVRLKTVS